MEIKKEQEISFLLEDIISLENYLKNLLNFFPLPTAILTSLGVIVDFNPAFEKISGYKNEEVIGENLYFLFEKEIGDRIFREIKEKKKIENMEIFLKNKEGEKIPVSLFSKAREEEGKILEIFISLYDLRKIKEAQEKLKETQNILEIRVRARTRETREKVEKLEEEVREKTKELEKRVRELEKFHRLTLGREKRLEELEKENKFLKRKLLEIITF